MPFAGSLVQRIPGAIAYCVEKATWWSLLILMGFLVWLWFSVSSWFSGAFATTTETSLRDLLIGSIQAESMLDTATQDVTANISIDQVSHFLKVPTGETNLVYAAVGEVHAGIDIHNIVIIPSVEKDGPVTLRLPQPAISSVQLNPERSEILANYRTWFGPKAGVDIYEEAQREAYAAMKSKACTDHILDAATHNAKVQIKEILEKAGISQVQFEDSPVTTNTCSMA
jgi:hypothetical protein